MVNTKFSNLSKYLMISLIIITIYIIAGKLGLSLAFLNKSASPIWPPTGIAIAGLIILGYRYWPSIFIGAFALNFSTTPSALVSLGISSGNTLEALLGAFLINRYAGGKHEIEKEKSLLSFFLIAAIVPLVSTSIGVASLWTGGLIPTASLSSVFLTWWTGNTVGALLFIPLILAFYNRAPIQIKKEHYPEIALAMFLLIIISTILFIGWPIQINTIYPLIFLCIPPLIWIAWISCLRVSITAVTILSVIAITGTAFNTNIFNINSVNISLIILQLFISVIIIITMSISVLSVEYRKAMESLKKRVRDKSKK